MKREGHPGTFVRWFLDREVAGGAGPLGVDRALLHLGHAIALLERGDTRGALDAANACARLDPGYRDRALVVARMAVRAEVAAKTI